MAAALTAISASIFVNLLDRGCRVVERVPASAGSATRSASSIAVSLTSDDNGGILNVPLLAVTTSSSVAGCAPAPVPATQTTTAMTAVRRRISPCMID